MERLIVIESNIKCGKCGWVRNHDICFCPGCGRPKNPLQKWEDVKGKMVYWVNDDESMEKPNTEKENKMKMNDVLQEVKAELAEERKDAAKEILKERLREVQEIKRAAVVAEEQLNKLLDMDIDDVVDL